MRYTLEDAGEPCFSASPHRHRRASPLRHVCPRTESTKPRVKDTPASYRSSRYTKGRNHLKFAESSEDEDAKDDIRDSSPNEERRAPRSGTHRKDKRRERSRVSRSPDERKKNGQRYSRDEDFESSSSSESDGTEEKTVKVHRSKHLLKPPKFDGVKSFETFWAQFRNCAEHNRWTRKQELVYLRNALDKEAANVLWDYGKEVTESLTGLT